jgi:hypothetical protein
MAPWKESWVAYVTKHQLNKNMSKLYRARPSGENRRAEILIAKLFPEVKEALDKAVPAEFPTCDSMSLSMLF